MSAFRRAYDQILRMPWMEQLLRARHIEAGTCSETANC